jgi:DNA-binding PadR family transcriptional regulator
VTFEILLALAEGEAHGYAILRDIAARTDGRLSLHPGTLYRALGRLLEDGLVEELEERPDPVLDDERRRYYRLTDAGRRAAAREATRLEGQVAAARARRLIGEGTA